MIDDRHELRHQNGLLLRRVNDLRKIGFQPADGVLDAGQRRRDIGGGFFRADRQFADFFGHHFEAGSEFTDSGRFDRRVQSQQIGLLGNFFDKPDRMVHLGGVLHGLLGVGQHIFAGCR
ncbi:hypothetical protein D1872_304230 [compost metagenome]